MLVATGLLRLRVSATNCARNRAAPPGIGSKQGHLGAAHVASVVLCSRVKNLHGYFQDHQISPVSKVNLRE